jgi:tetratricopeptide (TPR) repeat protein
MSQEQVETLKNGAEEDNPEFFNKQGSLLSASKKYDQAVGWFEKTINKKPLADKQLRVAAFEGAAKAQRELRHFDEAREMLRQAIETAGVVVASGTLLVQQGWLCFYQKSYGEASAQFQKAENELPENDRHEARVGLLASCHQLDVLSAPDGAQDAAQRLVKKWREEKVADDKIVSIFIDCNSLVLEPLNLYPAALRNADQLLEISENNPQGVYFKLSALKWLRRYGDVEKTYSDAPHELQTDIQIWREHANSYYEQKRFLDSYRHYSGKVLDGRDLTGQERALREALKTDLEAREWTIVSLRNMRSYDDALIEVNSALGTVDKKSNFLDELAAIHYARRNYDQAVKIFKQALELDDYDTFALQWRTASLRKSGKLPEAKEALKQALDKVPSGTRLWEESGWLAFDQGNFEQAITAFETAAELDPYLINRQFAKVEALIRLNRLDDALEVFKKLDQQFPDDAQVAEQRCWFHIRFGQLEAAREQQIKIKQAHPNSVLGLNAWGGYELAQRDYVAAEKAFREAIDKVDYEPQYYVNLAIALVGQVKSPAELGRQDSPRMGQLLDEAKRRCRKALELDPYNAKAYGCLGVIAFREEEFLEAEVYFRKSIDFNPVEGSHVELASLYCQMGRYEEAKTRLNEALKQTPKDSRVYTEFANVAVLTGDNKEAIRYCREAVFTEPKNPETHRALAIALMASEQYDEAELVVRRALSTLALAKPWRLYLLLAQILVRLGDVTNKDRKKKDLDLYEEALKYVNEARQAAGSPNADICFHAGIVQYRLDDYPVSQKNFSECVKLNRNRFDAERYSRIVQTAIDQQKRVFTLNQWFGFSLAIFCAGMLLMLWILYFSGHQRTIPVEPPTNANSAASAAAPTPAIKAEFTVDRPLLNVMTPILLGLLTVGILLPNLTKLKLPGFEAEISEPKSPDPAISSGPRGDIKFGSSLPIVDHEPR